MDFIDLTEEDSVDGAQTHSEDEIKKEDEFKKEDEISKKNEEDCHHSDEDKDLMASVFSGNTPAKIQESSSESDTEEKHPLQCKSCSIVFSSKSNLAKHHRMGRCKGPKRKYEDSFVDEENKNKTLNCNQSIFENQKKLLPSLWSNCIVQKSQSLPYDIDGDYVYELSYDKENIMKSSLDGRPWKQWNSSKRADFNGIRRITSCGGTYECRNSRCPYRHSFSTANKVQFKKLSEDVTACSCCGYQAVAVPCVAKKAWEFHDDKVLVYHCGRHSCTARKESCPDITESAKRFFHNNTSAKPSQFPYERLRGMLKEGKSVQEIYSEAKVMANLKKIQNIKQKVIQQENPAEHTFEALAKIKEASDSTDKFLLWSVKDGRVSDLTAVFRSSKERIDIACQMQRGNSHPLAEEYCFLDAEHNKVKGLKTINLTVQHPSLKECVTITSMDCETESTQTLCEFWKQLNSALREYTGERTYIFDPEGIITDEHGGNRESICRELKPDMVERSKSCEMHFYDCAHRVSKANWSPKSKKDFITMVHGIYTSETPGAYEARRRALLDWAQKEKRSHVKPWFNNFWHARRFHVFRAFKDPSAPNTNMAEVTHSRNATRGAKNDTLARVAEDHIVESALLKAKIESIKNGQYLGGRCADQKRKDDISLRRQLDRATQFAKDLKEGAFSEVQYTVGPYVKEKSGHRAKSDDLCLNSSSEEEATPSQKNAKKAFRKRGTRSQNLKESLAMAKKAKLKLVQIHHVSPVKKIFELDHDGRIHLTEIAETVSCNCSFGSRRDL